MVLEFDDVARAEQPYVDVFGCKWETVMDGIVGSVHVHPLADMSRYSGYRFQDPEKSTGLRAIDWIEFEAEVVRQKAQGLMTYGDLCHGHTFQQLCGIRGYVDTLVDLDIDRQKITFFGTPKEIDGYIRHCIETVGCPDGGLMLIYGLYPGMPLENVKTLMDAMTMYADEKLVDLAWRKMLY